jgi:hypothetical protein
MTSSRVPSSVMVAPSTERRSAKRRSHRRWLTITPEADARRSSAATKSRPSAGRAPSVANRFDDTTAYCTFSGSHSAVAHPPVRLKRESLKDVHTAMDSNDRARSRTSMKLGSDSGSWGYPLAGLSPQTR